MDDSKESDEEKIKSMRTQVEFIDTEGRLVNVSRPCGGPDGWHIYINHFYFGILCYKAGKWFAYLNLPPKKGPNVGCPELQSDDILELGERLEKKP